MKKINRSVLLLLLLVNNIYTSFAGNFKAYHEYVNKAEMNIIDGDYRSASRNYSQAFAVKEAPFATDLYNAAVAAIKSRDYNQSFVFCQKLALKGVGSDFFEKKSVFRPLRAEAGWKDLIAAAKQSRHDYELKNKVTLTWIKGLVDKDQEWHRAWGKSDYNHTLEMQMAAADDSLSAELMKVFDKHGFLGEDDLGVRTTNDTIIADPVHWIIILHNYQGRNNTADTLFTPVLRKALADEEISPRFFAMLQDHGTNMGTRAMYGTDRGYNIWDCNLYKYPSNAIFIADIEANRKEIGLPTLAEDEQRIFYCAKKKDRDFIIPGQVGTTGSFANKESEKTFLEYSILVLKDVCK